MLQGRARPCRLSCLRRNEAGAPPAAVGNIRLRPVIGRATDAAALRRLLDRVAVEGEAELVAGDDDLLAVLDGAGQDHLRERVLHRLLDHALQRPCAIGRIPALLGQPIARTGLERERDLALVQQLLQPLHLDVDDAPHLRLLEPVEQDDLVDPVQEFRPERRPHDGHDLIAHRVGVLAFRLIDQEFGA